MNLIPYVVFLVGITFGVYLPRWVDQFKHRGKRPLFELDGDTGDLRQVWVKGIVGNDIELHRVRDGKPVKERVTLPGRARVKFGRYFTWIVWPKYGWALTPENADALARPGALAMALAAPTEEATILRDVELQALSVVTPEAHAVHMGRNQYATAMTKNRGDDKLELIARLAWMVLIGILLVLAVVGYIVTHLPGK